MCATGFWYAWPRGSTCVGWLTPSPSRKRPSQASSSTRAALAHATGSRPQMFAIPLATTRRSVAASSTAPFVKDSRVPRPSGYQRQP